MQRSKPAPLALAAALALALAACSGDDTSTSSATAGETTSTSTTGETTSAETTSTSTSTTSGSASDSATTSTTTGDPTTTTTGDPTTTTTGDPTTTTGGVEFPLCEDFCAHIVECGAPPDPKCLLDCDEFSGIFHGIGPVCTESIDELLTCAIDLECVELGAFLDDLPSPCDDAKAKVDGDPPACALEEEPPDFCTAFCDQAEMCKLAEPSCLLDCTLGYGFGNGMSAECGAAFEAYYSCLAALDCDNLMNPVTCLDEATAVEALCMF